MESQEERFRIIYEQNYPLLRSIVRKTGVPEGDWQDVVQEAFTSFYSTYRNRLLEMADEEICALLARITHNCSVDYKRRQSVQPLGQSVSLELFYSLKSTEFGGGDMLKNMVFKEKCDETAEALKSLKKDWLDVIILYVVEERPLKEVCEILGIKEDACRMRLMRARKHLKEQVRQKEAPRIRKLPEASTE